MLNSNDSYLLHVKEDCAACLNAKSLLTSFNLEYTTTMDPCDEWPTLPAIYRVRPAGDELIGGYEELCETLLEEST